MRQLVLDFQTDAPARFENFVPGDNSALIAALHEAALAGSDPLYLWSAERCGKSHLLHAAVSLAAEAGRPSERLNGALVGNELPITPALLLAIDDIEDLSPEAQIALFNSFNRRHAQRQTLLLAGHCAPRDLQLREDLRTRIGQSLVFELHLLGDSARREILATLARRRGLRCDAEVLDFVLRHGRRDLPSLLATFEALDAASLERKRPITLPLLRSLLQNGLPL